MNKMEFEKTNWKCGDCGKLYSTNSLLKLKKKKAVDTDKNPNKEHGYVAVCSCGYVFHIDRWKLSNRVEFKLNWLQVIYAEVSTVDLELNHFGNYYETMIFLESEDWKCYFQNRYVTRAEARAGHQKVLKRIEDGKFSVDKKNKEIRMKEIW